MSICSEAFPMANEFSSGWTFRIRERSTFWSDAFSGSFFNFDRPPLLPLEVEVEAATSSLRFEFEFLLAASAVWWNWSFGFENESGFWSSIGFSTMWMFSPLWSCCNKFSSTYKQTKRNLIINFFLSLEITVISIFLKLMIKFLI